jgi:hypothetical protein
VSKKDKERLEEVSSEAMAKFKEMISRLEEDQTLRPF